MNVRFSHGARDEMREAYRFYEGRRKGLGQEFAREIASAVIKVREHPIRWPVLSNDVRRCLVNRFPYGIIYRPCTDHVRVLAIMHLSQRPGYWKRRDVGD